MSMVQTASPARCTRKRLPRRLARATARSVGSDAGACTISSAELDRSAAARRYGQLDLETGGVLDVITALAARRFGTPVSLVSIVDEERILFKSHHGLPNADAAREAGLCASAIWSNDPYVLNDASSDVRSQANSLVTGPTGVRFYAGVPLKTADGHNIGTLCVIDRKPRTVVEAQIDDLKDLAYVVMHVLSLRLESSRTVAKAELMAKEIDHRVMNSLQFVSSLLRVQGRSAGERGGAIQLEQAANRVAAVARIHRHINAADKRAATCVAFLRGLCSDLGHILDRMINVQGDGGAVPMRYLQPIGLLVNELVTNAAKHGSGLIKVAYRVQGERCSLTVSDQGPGLPEDFDVSKDRTSLGMRVIQSLAEQLKGTIEAGRGPEGGAQISVTFPLALDVL